MNAKSFKELYLQNKDRLNCSVLSLVRNRDIAEDIVSSAFLKAFKKRDSFRGEAALSTWLTAIAVNETRSFWRRDHSKRTDSIDSPVAEELIEPDFLIKTLERSEYCLRLRRALRQIPLRYRRILIDHFVRGHSTRKIARRERVPLGTVLSRIFKGKKLLRNAWEACR